MLKAVSRQSVALSFETNKREFASDLAAPVFVGLLCTLWLPLIHTVAWALAYSAVLVLSRADQARWAVVGITPPQWAMCLHGAAVGGAYSILPWVLVLHPSSAANVVGMVMVYAGALRGAQNFGYGRWAGIASTTPFLLPAVTPLGLGFINTPTAETGFAFLSCLSLFVYIAVMAAQQYELRAQLLDAVEDATTRQRGLESEKRFAEQILNTPLVSLAVLDRDLRFKTISPRFAERMKIDAKAGLGQTMAEAMPWAPPSWPIAQRRALQGERSREEAEPYRRPDGSLGWANWECQPWRDETGAIAGVILCGLDVTAIMEARQSAERSAELLRLALQGARSAVFELDLVTPSVSYQSQTELVVGRPMTIADFDIDGSDTFFDADKAEIKDLFTRAIKGEITLSEHRIKRHGDHAEVYLRNTYSVIKGASGRTERVVVMMTDITQQRQRETAVAAYLADAERVLDSRRALLATVARELELPPTPDEETETPRATAIGPGEERLDVMAAQLSRMLREIGARDAALKEMITALSEARHEAEASNASKSAFVANMSHELRTPLNAIIGYSEILMETAEADNRAEDMADLRRVLGAAKRLLALINEILDLSKIEAGRLELEKAQFDVADLVQSAAETVLPSAHANGDEVRVVIEEGIGSALGDGFRLSQCLLNLMSNAVKFTKDGTITVAARRERTPNGDWLVIGVSDTGIGISPQAQAKIFKPFTQADASTTRSFGGTGLGLTITKRLIEMMGGVIELESMPGEGSCFTLRVPANASEAHTASPVPAGRKATGGPTILLIDPDPLASDLAARAFARLGFHCETQATRSDAEEALNQISPALVILDVCLTEGQSEGEALLQWLTEKGAAPVLVVSAAEDRQRFMALGACASLVKPVGREHLCAAALQYAKRSEALSAPQATAPEYSAKAG
jgi:PAS domain S-box-containing protein